LEAPGAQARFYEALRQVLAAFLQPDSEGAPAGVLLFDDLHWADAASLDLLAYLARRLEGVFLLATWRSDAVPVGGPLRQLLAQAMRQGRGISLALPRLSAQDVTKIIQAVEARQELPGDLSERLYQETEGNPFFVTEYLKSTLQTGKQQSTAGWDMPVSVRDLIRMRLSGVGEISAQLLSAAAVVGRSFDFATLQAVSGRSELEIIGGLETLLGHQLFVEQAAGDPVNGPAYDFTHDKLRALVYEETSLARRRLLHQRAGEAFAGQARQRPGGASRSGLAAYHFQLAGLPVQAADHFRQAGEHARQLYANREAMAHFQNALACGHPDAASLHEAIGDLQTLSGEYSAALGSYEAAAALGAEEHQPWIDHKLGAVHAQRGDWELAECHFQVALETLGETGDPGERARICVDWSRTAHRRDNPERAQALARQALKLAEDCPDRRALAQAHNMLGILARGRRKLHLAHQHLRQSLEIAAEMGDSGMRVAALNNLARLHADQGQTEPALALTGEALQLCEQQGDRHRAAALHNNLADLYHTIGDEEQAMAHLKKAVIIFAEIGEQAGEGQSEIWKLAEW
jgi:predicted ATPase